MEPKILQYPDFNRPCIVTTEKKETCGAILAQNFYEVELLVAYTSKSFTTEEDNKSKIEQKRTAIYFTQ